MEKQTNEVQLNELIDAITAIASLDFSKKLKINGEEELIDVVSIGINLLSEALEDTVVSKQQLEESSRKYKTLFSKANDAILLIKNNRIVEFNEKTMAIFGHSVEDLKGTHLAILTPKYQNDGRLSWEIIKEMTAEALEKGQCIKKFQNIRKDQTIFEAEVNVGWFKLNEEIYFQTIVRDISARVKSEKALRKSMAQFKALFDYAPNAMLISRAGKLLQINPAFEEMFGYSQADIGHLNLKQLTHPADNNLHKKLEQRLIKRTIQKYSIEKRYIKKDGAILYGNVNVSLLKEFEDSKDFYIIQIVDITKQKLAEEKGKTHLNELEKINKELDQFAYIVSHDLKAPLRGINALANFMEEDILANEYEDLPENLGLLKNRIARMGNLITGILEFSRAGKNTEKTELIDAALILQETIELINPGDKVAIHLASNLPLIYSIKIGFQQIIQNLLSNAIKYNDKENCHIWITCQEKEDAFVFSIKDNGPGIAEEHHQKIFDVFQTLQPRDRIESTGVGLSIVRKRVESLGGKVWIESKLGKGATFIFSLPKKSRDYQKQPFLNTADKI